MRVSWSATAARRRSASALVALSPVMARAATVSLRASLRSRATSVSISATRATTSVRLACTARAAAAGSGSTFCMPAHVSGSSHRTRSMPLRSYLGPVGADSPPKRSRVSSPQRPRKSRTHGVVSSITTGCHDRSASGPMLTPSPRW